MNHPNKQSLNPFLSVIISRSHVKCQKRTSRGVQDKDDQEGPTVTNAVTDDEMKGLAHMRVEDQRGRKVPA